MIGSSIVNGSSEYIVIKKISEGGSSHVFHCYDFNKKKSVIGKIFKDNHIKEYGIVEVELYDNLKKNKCENVMNYIECFYIDNETYVIMMDAYSGDLYDYYDKFDVSSKSKKLIFMSILNGVCEMHNSNYNHCDIKPNNILIKYENDEYDDFDKIAKTKTHEQISTDAMHTFIRRIDNDENASFNDEDDSTLHMISVLTDNISSSDSDMEDEKVRISESRIIDVKLADIGTAKSRKDSIKLNWGYTQKYSPPEQIIGYNVYNTYDTWSLGCILYYILFDDELFSKSSRNLIEEHYSVFGTYPDKFIGESSLGELFFDKNCVIKSKNKINDRSNIISDFIKEIEKVFGHRYTITNILGIFSYNPSKRKTAHDIFNNLVQ